MKSHPHHHIHILSHLSLALLGVALSLTGFIINSHQTSAQVPTVFQGFFAGRDARQADLHWNYGGNDFEGLVFRGNHKTLTSPATVTINSTSKSCLKQVRGLYYNSARGQVLRPLDQESLVALQAIDSSYNNMTMQGGLYIGCDGNTTNVFGQVTHSIGSLERVLVAGVDIQTSTNTYNHTFANTLTFNNNTAAGYVVDSIGGVASVNGIAPGYMAGGEQTFVTPTQTIVVPAETGATSVIITINGTPYVATQDTDGNRYITTTLPNGTYTATVQYFDETETIIAQTTNNIIVAIPSGPTGPSNNPPQLLTDQQKGICEIRDCSDSYYDNECGVCDKEHGSADDEEKSFLIDNPIAFIKEVGNVISSMTCDLSQELVEAYVFAFDIGITTVPTICQADMMGPLIRKHMAKFLSMFAIQVLGMQPDLERECVFSDMATESFEMQGFARIACQLGIMGLQQDGSPDTIFNPNQEVTRAMFGTALSRLIYGPIHNSPTGVWYQAHLNALQADGIMTQINNPSMLEVRGYVMLMLMRAYQWLQNQ